MIWRERMRKLWKLKGFVGDVVVVKGEDLREYEQPWTSPTAMSALLERWLSDPLSQHAVINMYESVANGFSAAPRARGDGELKRALKPRLEEAFRRGELVVMRVRPRLGTSGSIAEFLAEELTKKSPVKGDSGNGKITHWISFEVLDDDTEQPVEGVKLMIKLPDGKVQAFMTNAEGRIDIRNLPPGSCDARCDLEEPRLANTRQILGVL